MTILAPKDQIHFRQVAMNMALSTHGDGCGQPDKVTATAQKFYDFLSNNTMSAPDAVQMPTPSGLPEVVPPLPTGTIDSAYARESATDYLRELRRQRVFELDVISHELKSRGVVPN